MSAIDQSTRSRSRTMATPMSSTLLRPPPSTSNSTSTTATAFAATPIRVALQYAMPPKTFAVGAVKNIAERSRLLELLRAPNNLTSPTLEPSSKGLLNGPGQNNCFLNCAVQVSGEIFI
ncbi:hypothetical protein ACLKA7_005927 [Drosophila subpalustris]